MSRPRRSLDALAFAGAVAVALAAAPHRAGAHEQHAQHEQPGRIAAASEHAHHAGVDHSRHAAQAAQPTPFRRSQHEYLLPDVTLRDQSSRTVSARELLQADDGPLAVNFIFATCSTICPVMTATFAQMLKELGPEAKRIRLVSITIDPEHDTPAVLAKYAERFDAPSGWAFVTGSRGDVESVLRAFDAWSGSKATHRPITLLRGRGASRWTRLEGLGSGAELAQQARLVLN